MTLLRSLPLFVTAVLLVACPPTRNGLPDDDDDTTDDDDDVTDDDDDVDDDDDDDDISTDDDDVDPTDCPPYEGMIQSPEEGQVEFPVDGWIIYWWEPGVPDRYSSVMDEFGQFPRMLENFSGEDGSEGSLYDLRADAEYTIEMGWICFTADGTTQDIVLDTRRIVTVQPDEPPPPGVR